MPACSATMATKDLGYVWRKKLRRNKSILLKQEMSFTMTVRTLTTPVTVFAIFNEECPCVTNSPAIGMVTCSITLTAHHFDESAFHGLPPFGWCVYTIETLVTKLLRYLTPIKSSSQTEVAM
jgi:hypothetical protein